MASKTFNGTVVRIVRKELDNIVQTSYPAVVVDVSKFQSTQTIVVQPLIQVEYEDGQQTRLPIIYDVPVAFPGGDDSVMSFPLKVGNIIALQFVKSSLEEFIHASDPAFYTPTDRRTFSLNDCYAIPRLFTKVDNLNPHPDNVEIKFKGILFSLTPSGTVNITTGSSSISMGPNSIVMNSGSITMNGAVVDSSGNVTTAAGVSVDEHIHLPGAYLGNLGNPLTGQSGAPVI
jgi:hypothetical protein